MSYSNPYENDTPYDDEYEMNNNMNAQANINPYENNDDLNNAPLAPSHMNNTNDNDFVVFMNKINHINDNLNAYEAKINQIDILHKQLLTEVNETRELEFRQQLDNLVSQVSDLQFNLKNSIKDAQREALNDDSKHAQAENSRQRFLKLIQDYRIVDSNYKDENKQQAMRQYKIIQPDATEDEVENAINDIGGQQIFSQALLNANRRGEAKTALAEVQARHQELLKLEKTMAELNQLFNDMEELVIEQQENIEVIDKNVEDAQQDMEQGLGHTNKAVKSAKRARKNKIRCYIILFVAFAIVVVVVVVPTVVKTR